MTDFPTLLRTVSEGTALSQDEAVSAFTQIMNGEVGDAQMAAFLTALKMRGETVDELTGGVTVLREKVTKVETDPRAIDTCGTGGDAKGTLNVSTAVALVVAACDVPVAKHGNRSLSSKSGSSQVLEELGVNVNLDAAGVANCVKRANIGFMMAPVYHAAMKNVGPVRQALGFRTIFNLLGPLANPAGTKRQLIGVFDQKWIEPFAEVLNRLGSEKAWIVHGAEGLDELSISGPSFVAELDGGKIRTFEVKPEDAGLNPSPLSDILGGDPAYNAAKLQALAEGEHGAYRDIVVLNAAAALVVAGAAPDLKRGAQIASDAIACGNVLATLHKLVEVSNG